MFFTKEEPHQKQEEMIQKLSLQIEIHNHLVDELFEEMNVSPEQLSAFISQQEAFTERNWETLLTQQRSIEEKLERDLANVRNPLQVKKSRDSLHIQPQWISLR